MPPNKIRRLTPTTVGSLAITLFALALLTSPATADNAAVSDTPPPPPTCERLATSLTYSQDAAPADVSGILRVVVEKINRDVTGVVDVEVAWSGAELHKRVGERIVKCTVTRLMDDAGSVAAATAGRRGKDDLGRDVVTQCFEVPIAVSDVNECTLPKSNAMAHRCHPSALCVNTSGSYECVCPADGAASKPLPPDFAADSAYWRRLAADAASNRSAWELSLASSAESSCPGAASTHRCCDDDGRSPDGRFCRSSFVCPKDPCSVLHTHSAIGGNHNSNNEGGVGRGSCAPDATCRRADSPLAHPDHVCDCPEGHWGSGRACVPGMDGRPDPKVGYDGVTPTEETKRKLDAGLICGCSLPVVDACAGFPKCPGKHETCTVTENNTPQCACRPGYVRDDRYGCVDEHPPVLELRPDPAHTDPRTHVTHLSQGDKYVEFGVDVRDTNAEEYLRSLKITYSRALPQGCLSEMGEFYVNYTVATPWTTPEFVRATRTVVVENVDECGVREGLGVGANCPELVAMCDVESGAVCKDEIGTYSCLCPEGTEGDGFRLIPRLKPDGKGGFIGSMVPRGYKGGTGCRDTSRPVIEILGPNPKVFQVAKVNGLKGVMRTGEDADSHERVKTLNAEHRSGYERDLRSMIRATSGAELCATTAKPNVRPTDCIRATDRTYKGLVDLTGNVSVGEPISKDGSPLHWRVPYNVVDEAGNKAKTVWREVIIKEVDLNDFEQHAIKEARANHEEDVKMAVNDAIIKERKRAATLNNNNKDTVGCSACKPCNCNDQQGTADVLTVNECDEVCDRKISAAIASQRSSTSTSTCDSQYADSSSPESGIPIIDGMIVFMEELIGKYALMMLFFGCTLSTALFVLGRTISALISTGPDVRTYYHTRDDDEREKIMMQNVSYYRSPTPSNGSNRPSPSPGSTSSVPRPPTASMMSAQQNGIFSPQQHRGAATQQSNGQTQYASPFATHSDRSTNHDNDNIYQSMSPITPTRNSNTPGSTMPSNTPGSRYNLRSTNY